MEIFFVRHGVCNYPPHGQDIDVHPASTLIDLLPEGIDQVAKTAQWIKSVYKLSFGKFGTSPYGRTVHSAQILQMAGLGKSLQIECVPELKELAGLCYPFILALVEGGTFEYEGQCFTFNKGETNPFGCLLPEYLLYDHLHQVPESVVQSYPGWVEGFFRTHEAAASGVLRCKRFLKGLVDEAQTDGEQAVIAVTHDGLTSWLAQLVSPTLWQLRKGFAIRMETRGEELWMTHFENEQLMTAILVPLTDPALS